jgi:hypothetical protein
VPHPVLFTAKQLAIQPDILVTGYGKILWVRYCGNIINDIHGTTHIYNLLTF